MRDFSELLWQDMPASTAVSPEAALPVLRLHTVGAWDVDFMAPGGSLHILLSHATAPVFDGPEDRNGLRNGDELRFWQLYLGGWAPDGAAFAADQFVLLGTFNVDPGRGEGLREPILDLIGNPALQDPVPPGPTTDWDEPTPGNLRVDYILPAASLAVVGAGILWPEDGEFAETVAEASDHRLVWVDLEF